MQYNTDFEEPKLRRTAWSIDLILLLNIDSLYYITLQRVIWYY